MAKACWVARVLRRLSARTFWKSGLASQPSRCQLCCPGRVGIGAAEKSNPEGIPGQGLPGCARISGSPDPKASIFSFQPRWPPGGPPPRWMKIGDSRPPTRILKHFGRGRGETVRLFAIQLRKIESGWPTMGQPKIGIRRSRRLLRGQIAWMNTPAPARWYRFGGEYFRGTDRLRIADDGVFQDRLPGVMVFLFCESPARRAVCR